ncbi:hypothetical protein Q361_11750 [Flavobacterium croceum DSM 17960]|uniref:Uncharacterized protein n=1 Tax=Flavobacterium croceum DSM 17960 TaxID=1121886 RepID=A0A2S4N5J9_9FLAO|nr:hypothetical protein [Flavobacterium croceum]POS00946.1 hypothetical protein Q361_11750 [Flavobacterium croceum DSM 17960]
MKKLLVILSVIILSSCSKDDCNCSTTTPTTPINDNIYENHSKFTFAKNTPHIWSYSGTKTGLSYLITNTSAENPNMEYEIKYTIDNPAIQTINVLDSAYALTPISVNTWNSVTSQLVNVSENKKRLSLMVPTSSTFTINVFIMDKNGYQRKLATYNGN